MIYLFSYVFPIAAIAIGFSVLVALVGYVMEIQHDIRNQR